MFSTRHLERSGAKSRDLLTVRRYAERPHLHSSYINADLDCPHDIVVISCYFVTLQKSLQNDEGAMVLRLFMQGDHERGI